MPVLIRSQGGERSFTLMGNATKKKSSDDIKQELAEALKGFTIKFELKITDVIDRSSNSIEKDSDRQATEHLPRSHELPPQESTQPKALNTDTYQPPKTSIQNATNPSAKPIDNLIANGTVLHNHIERSTNELAEVPKKVASLSFAPIQALKRQSDISGSAQSPIKPQPDRDSQLTTSRDSIDQNNESSSKTTMASRMAQIMQIKTKIDSEAEPPKGKLIRAEFNIGDTITTVVTNEDDTGTYVAHSGEKILDITKKVNDLSGKIESQPALSNFQVGDIVFGKSCQDDAWYRAAISKIDGSKLEVDFFDWGITEEIESSRIREILNRELMVTDIPACAMKVSFTNAEQAPDDQEFKIRVDSYDEIDKMYYVSLL